MRMITIRGIFCCTILLAFCTQRTSAIACDPGTYDNGAGGCSNCDTSACLECDVTPTQCTFCQDGKYLSSSQCFNCPTGCQKCTDANVCSACTAGYVLASTKCITESQARAANSSNNSTSSGLHFGWIIAITAGGAIILALVIWGLVRYLKKKPAVQKLDDTIIKPPQETIDLFKALFAAQNSSGSGKPTEGTTVTNASFGESASLKTGKPDSKKNAQQSSQPPNLGALFGGMMSTKDKAHELNAPKAPPPFLAAFSNIPGITSGKAKDVVVDSQASKAKPQIGRAHV